MRIVQPDLWGKGRASPNLLVRNWPPAFTEWSTKSVRDAFFASPQFARLLDADAVKETIARGVASGHLAYVGKSTSGGYEPFKYACDIRASDVEISDEMYIITKEAALAYKAAGTTITDRQGPPPGAEGPPSGGTGGEEWNRPGTRESGADSPLATSHPAGATASILKWSGEVTSQKWMNFYTKVLSKFAAGKGLTLRVSVEVSPEDGISIQRVEETKVALRELGLKDDVRIE
ncbi:MAG: hypothetical protein HY650_08930 [Acidobacteria bacterium]|nr:hypothetical protein [Acidobacteriota bacterium]